MLSSIRLTHFKCFEQLDLKCAAINLLCGLNGMGKSSVIQALLVLRQSYEAGELSDGRLVLGGDRADLGAGSDVLFEDAESDELGFELESDETTRKWRLFFEYSGTADQLIVRYDGGQGPPIYVSEEWRTTPPFGGSFIYVDADRAGPRKTYPLSNVRAMRGDFGASSEYAWNYLIHHQDDLLSEGDARCEGRTRRLIDVVDQWLQYVSPGAHVQLERIVAADAVIAGFSFDRPGDVTSRRHRATNVGFGLSYSLPVIIGLLSGLGTLCLIENPESHLHPRGQTRLAELAVRAASEGVQVFAETHSDHFMDGIRIAVRDGLIAPEDATFHYFERDGNRSVVTSPAIDAEGRISTWPVGFFDQGEQNLARLLSPRQPLA